MEEAPRLQGEGLFLARSRPAPFYELSIPCRAEKGLIDAETEQLLSEAGEAMLVYNYRLVKFFTASGANEQCPPKEIVLAMATYLARPCPRCNGYLGIVLREPGRNVPIRAVNGHCLKCDYRLAWIVINGEQAARHQSGDKLHAESA